MIYTLYRRAKDIFQTEGLIPLLRGIVTFFTRRLYNYGEYYLYEHAIRDREEADFMPKIRDFTLKIVSSNQQADELTADGFKDFREVFLDSRRGLDRGAVAFCVYVGQELAHIGWVGMTEEAKNAFDDLPYHVDFANKEACTGGTVTIPKYERNGLMKYVYFMRFNFLGEKGIVKTRNAVETDNLVSQRVHAKFGPKIYARRRHLRILRWRWWKEMPLAQAASD